MNEISFVDEVLKSQYDYELQSKDNITNKIQASLALYASLVTVISYMARMTDYDDSNQVVLTLFYSGLFVSILFDGVAAYYTGIVITGFKYELLPNPVDVMRYKNEIKIDAEEIKKYNEEYNADIFVPNPDVVTNDLIIESLAKCVEINRNINNIRNIGFTKSIGCLINGSYFLLFSTILFIACDLDASSPRKENSNQGTAIANEIKEMKPLLEKIANKISQDALTIKNTSDQQSYEMSEKNCPFYISVNVNEDNSDQYPICLENNNPCDLKQKLKSMQKNYRFVYNRNANKESRETMKPCVKN